MVGAMVIPDVSIIFEFISAFSVSAIQFTLPGLFFYSALKTYGTFDDKRDMKFHYTCAKIYIVMGCIQTAILPRIVRSSIRTAQMTMREKCS